MLYYEQFMDVDRPARLLNSSLGKGYGCAPGVVLEGQVCSFCHLVKEGCVVVRSDSGDVASRMVPLNSDYALCLNVGRVSLPNQR